MWTEELRNIHDLQEADLRDQQYTFLPYSWQKVTTVSWIVKLVDDALFQQ